MKTLIKKMGVCSLTMAALCFASCSDNDDEKIIGVESVTLSETNPFELTISDQITLTATVLPANAPDRTVQWSSSTPSRATVNQEGVVSAYNEGETTIRATSVADPAKYAEVQITVVKQIVPVSEIILSGEFNWPVNYGAYTLIATVLPENASNKTLMWHSSNEEIATVADGVITPVTQGATTITVASVAYPTVTASVEVTIGAAQLYEQTFTVNENTQHVSLLNDPAYDWVFGAGMAVGSYFLFQFPAWVGGGDPLGGSNGEAPAERINIPKTGNYDFIISAGKGNNSNGTIYLTVDKPYIAANFSGDKTWYNENAAGYVEVICWDWSGAFGIDAYRIDNVSLTAGDHFFTFTMHDFFFLHGFTIRERE
jgi:hypothetical protein